ncbi:mucin-2-like [Pseudophryne corroboree]|uniref:mucin-2-like n=1 Tax=Pseudophryne corroboree TaxID=495146 RepID=UPI00308142D3
MPGYFGNGINCTAMASCTTATCCSQGYTWDSRVGYKVCTDINECTDSTLNKCVPTSTCINRVGVYLCGNNRNIVCNNSICPFDQDCLNIGGVVQCADPCSYYQLQNGTTRLSTINSTGVFATDRYNVGWYRYSGSVGLRMQQGCVGSIKCGSAAPFTLNSSHPAIGQGVVLLPLLSNTVSGCTAGGTIPVKACSGQYYVYKFSESLGSEVYCTDPTTGFVIPTMLPTTTTTTATTTSPTTTTTPTTTTPTTTTTTPTTTTPTTTTTTPTTTTIPTTTTTTPTTTTTTPTTTTTTPTTTTPTTTTTTPTTTTIPTTTTTTPTTTTTTPTTTTIPTTTTTTPTTTTTTPTTTTIPTTTTTTPTTTTIPTTTTTPTTTTPTTTTPTTTTTTPTTTSTPTTTTPTKTTTPTTSTPNTTSPTATSPSTNSTPTTPVPTATQPEQNFTVTTLRGSTIVRITATTETVNGTDVTSLELNETTNVYIEVMTITPTTIRTNINNSVTPFYYKLTIGTANPMAVTDTSVPQTTGNETIVPNQQLFQPNMYSSQPAETSTTTETFTVSNINVTSITTTTTIITEEIIVK